MAKQIFAKGLSVRETERLIRQHVQNQTKLSPPTKAISIDVQRLQIQLSEKLGASVSFVQGAKGKGKMLIHYNSLDELDGILAHIH
jgi:ParB family transcriptional regulator, chromosome partitioning protein